MPPQRNPTTEPNTLEIKNHDGNVHPEPMDIPIYEAAPHESQVMDTIGQLVSALDRDRLVRQPVEGNGCSLKNFCNHH
jgi:hypothetical protein